MADKLEAKPARRRRKKLTREEREKRAKYMARYRAGKAPEEKPATPQPQPSAALVADGTPQQAPVVSSAPPGLTLELKVKMLSEALAGTVEALADTAQLMWLDADAPHLGRERSKTLGALWAPILAPYIDEDMAKWLPLALAAGGTANAAYAWAHEYKAFVERRDKAKSPLAVVPDQPTEVSA